MLPNSFVSLQFPVIYPSLLEIPRMVGFPGPNLTYTKRWEKQERVRQFMELGHGGNGDEDGIQSEGMSLKEVEESFLTYLRREESKDEHE